MCHSLHRKCLIVQHQGALPGAAVLQLQRGHSYPLELDMHIHCKRADIKLYALTACITESINGILKKVTNAHPKS